ncbi:hypothetical protein ACJW30_06G205000 [Castanea mollissima]
MGTQTTGTSCGLCSFVIQMLRGKWFMMFASFLIMTGAGATYLFGVYSKDIKATLGYDQSTLNLLSTCKDLGANVEVLSGLLAEVTPARFVLLIGSAMNFAGYFLIWLAVCRKIPKPKVWQMCLYICVGANSQNFANTPGHFRGIMPGLMNGYVGLSEAVSTQLYLAIYGDDSKSLILLIGWLPALISMLKVFSEYLYISIALALCLMGLTIAQKQVTFFHHGYVGSCVAVCVLIFFHLVIAIREELATWRQKRKPVDAPNTNRITVDEPTLPESKPAAILHSQSSENQTSQDISCCGKICKKPTRGEDYSILQALLSMDMLIIFVAAFCGLGCSLTAVDNLGQIGESLGYPQHTTGTFVSLVSIWNYFGRAFAGFVSEIILLWWKVPRPLIMTLSLVLSGVGDLLVAFLIRSSVYIASLIIAFGLKYYSTLFNYGQLASPLGSYIFNALKQLALKGMTRSMVKELTCMGKECYRLSFVISAGANFFGDLVLFALVMRTRDFYRGDIYKRFKEEDPAS